MEKPNDHNNQYANSSSFFPPYKLSRRLGMTLAISLDVISLDAISLDVISLNFISQLPDFLRYHVPL